MECVSWYAACRRDITPVPMFGDSHIGVDGLYSRVHSSSTCSAMSHSPHPPGSKPQMRTRSVHGKSAIKHAVCLVHTRGTLYLQVAPVRGWLHRATEAQPKQQQKAPVSGAASKACRHGLSKAASGDCWDARAMPNLDDKRCLGVAPAPRGKIFRHALQL